MNITRKIVCGIALVGITIVPVTITATTESGSPRRSSVWSETSSNRRPLPAIRRRPRRPRNRRAIITCTVRRRTLNSALRRRITTPTGADPALNPATNPCHTSKGERK